MSAAPGDRAHPEYAEGQVLVVIQAPEEPASWGVMNNANRRRRFEREVSDQAENFVRRHRDHRFRSPRTYPEIARISRRSIIHLTSETKSTEELIQALSSDPSVIRIC